MKYCTECGNEVQEGTRFCPNCGHDLAPPAASQPGDRPAIQALNNLNLTSPQRWTLLVLSIGGLLGFIGLWVDWTGDEANVVDYLKEGFGDYEVPWWIGVIALGAILGVVLTALNIVSTVRRSELPPSWQLRLGGVLMGVCPLITHLALVAWLVVEWSSGDAGDYWDLIWESESAGIWIALTGGILASWATALGTRISALKF